MTASHRVALALFARYPEPGRVKTRLAAQVGKEAAFAFYESTLRSQIEAHRRGPYELFVYLTPASEVEIFARQHAVCTRPQVGADLGKRMANCFRSLLRSHGAAAIGGTDIPSLTPERVCEALEKTVQADVVLGPCPDGGYYLIAMRRELPVFSQIPWGTPDVLTRTLSTLRGLGLSWALLPEERDVDVAADLRNVRQESQRHYPRP